MENENIIDLQNEFFEIRFDYPIHEIRANVLSEYIKNFNLIIQDITHSQGFVYETVIKATPEGSFKIKAFLQKISKSDIEQSIKFREDPQERRFIITTTLTILGALGYGYLELLKLDQDKTHIKTENGNVVMISDSTINIEIPKEVDRIWSSYPNIKSNFAKMNTAISKDNTLSQVDITYNNEKNKKQVISWNREDIIALSNIKDTKVNLKPFEYINLYEQSIKVTKVDFEGKSKWTMIFNGEKQSVAIDSDTLAIMQKERISDRDQFIVDITITQKYDEHFDSYINYKYTITYLHKHIPFEDPEQSLFE
ncbi:MAG: hypothetical protein ACRC0X_09035 [Brevinema sp.]